jgi:hypothetical protein
MSEPQDTTSDDFLDKTLDEHTACLQRITDLENCLDRRPDDPERWLSDLCDKTSKLREALGLHVEGEEAGPMFMRLPIRHPRLAARLAGLKAEHPRLLEDLDTVLKLARELREPRNFELRELNARVQLALARIRRHEASENELLIEAHWDEIGVGD